MKKRNLVIMVDELPQFIQRWFFGVKPLPFRILHAPIIHPVNEFLAAFVRSSEPAVQFSANDLVVDTAATPLLAPLQDLDYDTIRCRLRVMSSLDPVVNLKAESGIIECTMSISGVPHGVRLRSTFPPKGASIHLEKLEIIPSHLRKLRDIRTKAS